MLRNTVSNISISSRLQTDSSISVVSCPGPIPYARSSEAQGLPGCGGYGDQEVFPWQRVQPWNEVYRFVCEWHAGSCPFEDSAQQNGILRLRLQRKDQEGQRRRLVVNNPCNEGPLRRNCWKVPESKDLFVPAFWGFVVHLGRWCFEPSWAHPLTMIYSYNGCFLSHLGPTLWPKLQLQWLLLQPSWAHFVAKATDLSLSLVPCSFPLLFFSPLSPSSPYLCMYVSIYLSIYIYFYLYMNIWGNWNRNDIIKMGGQQVGGIYKQANIYVIFVVFSAHWIMFIYHLSHHLSHKNGLPSIWNCCFHLGGEKQWLADRLPFSNQTRCLASELWAGGQGFWSSDTLSFEPHHRTLAGRLVDLRAAC